jgi:VCBS repeat-containing protein
LVKGPEHGELVLNANGTFQFTPAADWTGDDVFTVSVSDGKAAPVLAVVPVHVEGTNDAPTVSDTKLTVPTNAKTGDLVGVVAAHDMDGDVLTYAIASGNDAGAFAIDSRTGAITLADMAALHRMGNPDMTFVVSVSDASGATAFATISVHVESPSVRIHVGLKSATTINLKGSPWVPVVIYSNDSLDVRDVSVGSLTFGRMGDEASLKALKQPIHFLRDIDGDGKLDLVVLVDVYKTGLHVGDTSVVLKGVLKNGHAIIGSSTVSVTSSPVHSNGKAGHVCHGHQVPQVLSKKKK